MNGIKIMIVIKWNILRNWGCGGTTGVYKCLPHNGYSPYQVSFLSDKLSFKLIAK